MKLALYTILLTLLIPSEYSNRYYESMDKGIQMFDSSKTEEDFLQVSNYFYRISQVVKTDWLSSYYYAYCNTSLSMMQEDSDLKEDYLDKALNILAPFDTLKTSNLDSLAMSEIYTLRAMIYVGKIFINPMINGMKYGPLSEKNIEKAKKFNESNPRPYYLSGQSKFYTPSAFGGGVDKALPILSEALNYYEIFNPKKYWPNWGYEDCKYLYGQALDKIENEEN
tara:strand:- start:1138 stop:1809 length:672 start_codon:yes stop_codon:yes gene_type:complete